ncbi:MAG TPA: hypothetical protein DCW88_25410 [Agrobacterium sp.]|nr:hypothetical protein EGT36_15110 [Agrobacterium sp. FDAARGOS_525]HAU78733.1 hypothetical protein [Agrobacterium sp.]
MIAGNRSSLIPVLVTGIQRRASPRRRESFQPKDLGWKDSCDEHRDEDERMPLRENYDTHMICISRN